MKRFAILLIYLWHSVDGKGAVNTAKVPPPSKSSALQKVTNDLSILSRLANGIALQKELNAKTINVNGFLAELLGMDPNDNGMDSLLKIDLNKVPDDYAQIASQASSIKPSSLDASKVQKPLEILGSMGNDVNALREGANMNLTGILNTATASLNIEKILFTSTGLKSVIDFSINMNATFNLEGHTQADANIILTSFYYLKDQLTHFREICKKILNHEKDLKDFWLMSGASKKLESVAKLAESAKIYNESFTEITAVDTDMKHLTTELTALYSFFEKFSSIKSVAEKLNSLKKAFEKLSSSKVSNRLMTAGFPRGTSDISLLFVDLKDEWLKEKIANNNQTALNQMINDLGGLKTFNQKATQYENSWNIFKESTKLTNIQTSSDLWNSAVENEMKSSTVQQLQKSTSEIGTCLEELTTISIKADFVKFNELLTKLKTIDEASVKAKGLLAKIAEIEILHNEEVYKSLGKVLDPVAAGLSESSLRPTIDILRGNTDYQELLKGVIKASSIMKELEGANVVDALKNNVDKWDEITDMQNVLNGTNLIDSLDCLKNNKFDNAGIAKVLIFGSRIRSLGEFHRSDKSMVAFIKQASQLKTIYANVTVPSSKSRPKRSISFDSLDNALGLSQDIGKGINLLQKMSAVYNKKNTLMEVANYEKEVFLEMKNIVNTIDTSSFSSALSKTVKDLDSLEEYAKKNSDGDLQNIGGVFEQASAIPGVPIDSKQLEDPISTSFRNSPNENVKKAAPSFKVLGSLQLDYSNHRSDFKTASLSVIKLKDYFDSFFIVSSSRSQSGSQSGGPEIPKNYLIGGGTIFFVVGFFIAAGIWFSIDLAHKKKAMDPDTYRHWPFAGGEEEQLVKNSTYLRIHESILLNNWKRFKRCVKNGANVNAYGEEFGYLRTPLHVLISFGTEKLKYAKYLLKNGADMNMTDNEYLTPLQVLNKMDQPKDEDKKLIQLFKKYQKKKYHRRLPPKFEVDNYYAYIDLCDGTEDAEKFVKKYDAQYDMNPDNIQKATHIVFPTLEDGSVALDISDENIQQLLPHFFGPKLIMKQTWLKASVESPKNFRDDFKFRVESVTINGVKYDNVIKIHRSIVERRIPFLNIIHAYFINDIDENMARMLARTVKALGGVPHDYGCYPLENDEQFNKTDAKYRNPRFHHRDDLGPIFVFTNKKEELIRDCGFLVKNNTYTIIDPNAFLDLVFKFEARHHKLPGHKADSKTLEIEGIKTSPQQFVRRGNVKDGEWKLDN